MKTSERVLKYIIQHREMHGYAPTIREICEGVGLRSSSTVNGHLQRLEQKGRIKRKPASPRAIEVIANG
ncbi:LexA family protein [Paenibacillus sp.]|uniref:LexA family protein n=1 Tax=Paenibacillus sp. TaxID=58172 RepID=UPI002D735233|nr:winged helix-turn-helix transcriptional regulator [Paenibacillus sp.]HZG83858.1 winged helix-turn-helix transcriptional regulator [Paenibacillus sp.]